MHKIKANDSMPEEGRKEHFKKIVTILEETNV